MFGPAIIKRVLKNFVPDEFSPNPIPPYIIHILSAEVSIHHTHLHLQLNQRNNIFKMSKLKRICSAQERPDSPEEMVTCFPYVSSATKYSPPPAALLSCVGEVGKQVLKSSRLSTLKKSYSSDDEMDEVDSPLTKIIPDSYQSSAALAKLSFMPKEKGGTNAIRYQLLREIWRDDD